VQIVRAVELPAPADRAFEFVDDLARYPTWMRLVREAEPTGGAAVDPPADAMPSTDSSTGLAAAWIVELQAQVGPFARSKRLRMVRTVHLPNTTVRFERSETDGRSHAPWTLQADLVESEAGSTRLTMTLTYGGSLWTGAVLQRVLDDEVSRGSESLVRQVAHG
jgi:Polyketide cyclase / dehydrase and lipid transport